MPRIASTREVLRLVDAGAGGSLPAGDEMLRRRSAAVASENRAAAGLPVDDARMVFAEETARQLQGGTAALLTPERRRGLMNRAERLGLRAFDANMIIAIMQDRARAGDAELGAGGDSRLALIRPIGGARCAARGGWMRWLAAAALAGGIFVMLVLWMV